MTAVTVRNVRKSFGDLEVIHGIDLNIEDGSFVVLLGPSGCGKSTLLRMIAGLEPISAGEIAIGGRVVNDLHPKDRDIAMVFQNYALYAHMSVFDNMAFSMQLKKMPQAEIKKRVDWAASILDLTSYLGRYPRQLSGGQRQRVAMGRAIVRDPAGGRRRRTRHPGGALCDLWHGGIVRPRAPGARWADLLPAAQSRRDRNRIGRPARLPRVWS